MEDLVFRTQVQWSGTGNEGEGQLTIGEEVLPCSSPENMGGKGVGVSPEELLIGSVSSCYSGTLFTLLTKIGLPVDRINISAEGFVSDYPVKTKFSQLILHPTIIGGDSSKQSDYEEAAAKARIFCFIGKAIEGNVDYRVGTVHVKELLVRQGKIDELVEKFYQKLMEQPYFSSMFAERNVSVETLKERQKQFISKLANENAPDKNHSDIEQMKKRHPFSTTPERAEIWLNLMEETMTEIQLPQATIELLVGKMNRLMKPLLNES
ncbi:OsmC family protein [Planococcus salinus]|uniref:OsmC family peroxiredoxin n=1 Tax=Planococcus salinus TaxID=1848460 RepID=A0A3M8PAU5_9BACL|nr:OsmC family protein [Planococcus salinus]RNF40350.1 hypothetical protein EEX84_02670 [Planococcus salinus]